MNELDRITTQDFTHNTSLPAMLTANKLAPVAPEYETCGIMATISLLIINPNSTTSMTDALKPLVTGLRYPNTQYHFFTASSGPKSINDDADASESERHCLPYLLPLLDHHDGFLVACYSNHPLTWTLRNYTRKPIVQISTASVTTALQLISRHQTFGIVSTGDVWESLLTNAVHEFIGVPAEKSNGLNRTSPFAGVETTGLNATDLHNAPAVEVRRRIKEATKRLLDRNHHGDVRVICLGCAGMTGMEEVVREACTEKLGDTDGSLVRVVDGVKAGVGILQSLVRGGF